MNEHTIGAKVLLLILCFVFSGCGGPLARADADRSSESKWEIKRKGLVGGIRNYDVALTTKGNKFKAEVATEYKDPMMGGTITETYTVLSDGNYAWKTDQTFNGEKSEGATKWKIDPDLFRSQLFWKSNNLAPNAEEKGTEEIDGKSYKKYEALMGNALGGTTIYNYYIDENNFTYRRLTKQFKDDNHVNVYDCVEYKGSTSASDSDFTYDGEAETVLGFKILP